MTDICGLVGGTVLDPVEGTGTQSDVLVTDGVLSAFGDGVAEQATCLVRCDGHIDAGSAGAATVACFEQFVRQTSPIPTWSLLNVSSIGLADLRAGELLPDEAFDAAGTLQVIKRFPQAIKGLKVRGWPSPSRADRARISFAGRLS
jgi:predicted amidohydrolase